MITAAEIGLLQLKNKHTRWRNNPPCTTRKGKTMSHTPAPWKFESSTKTIRSVPANYWIATIDSFDGAVDHEANARLIAAAPEMLEALKLARDELNIELARFGNGTSKGALRNARDAVQFAISQAEGRV